MLGKIDSIVQDPVETKEKPAADKATLKGQSTNEKSVDDKANLKKHSAKKKPAEDKADLEKHSAKEKTLKKEQDAKEKSLKKEQAAKEKLALKEKTAHEKAAYQMAIKGLKDIKEALKRCSNKGELDLILIGYRSIDVSKTEVQEYIKKHKRAANNLTALQNRIEDLSKAKKQRFSEQDSNTAPLSKSITLSKSETKIKEEPSAPANSNTLKETPIPDGATIAKLEQLKEPTVEAAVSLKKEDSKKDTVEPPKPIADEAATIAKAEDLVPSKIEDIMKTPVEEATKNEITSTLNVELDSAKEQRIVRERQLSEFTKHLNLLAKKRDNFHDEYPKDLSENPNKVYGAMCLLVKSLEHSAEFYKNGLIDLKQFKDETTQAIRDKRNGVISNHRGYKEIFYNLLLAIGTLGIGYAVAALFTHRLTPIQINTDSVNKLDQTQESINMLNP